MGSSRKTRRQRYRQRTVTTAQSHDGGSPRLIDRHVHHQTQAVWDGGNEYEGRGARVADVAYYQHHHTAASSSLNSALAATGTMIGNIAKGLMEGAGPVINNMIAMHKASHLN